MFSFLKRRTRKQKRLQNHSLILLGVGVAFGLIVFFVHPFASFNWQLRDSLFTSTTPSPNIIIAAIDDETLDTYGRIGDWDRSLHAQAIDNLSGAGARAIGFDVLFAEEADGDAELEAAMQDAGNVVLAVVGTDLLSLEGGVVFSDFLAPTTALSDASAALAHVNVLVDGDGIVRRLPITARDVDEEAYSSLSTAVLAVALGEPASDIPVDDSGSMRINYVGGPGSFAYVSYKDVITGDFDPKLLMGKIVLVGMAATGGGDVFSTPISSEQMYGVEIHANAIDTILRGRFVTESGRGISLITILILTVICGLLLPRLTLRKGGLLTIALLGAFVGALLISFDKGYMLDVIYAPVALALLFVSMITSRIVTERASKQEVTSLFGKYVSPQVAGTIIEMADRDELALGGENREVTVLFADMRGFTRISKEIGPNRLVDMLNAYFSALIDKISANEGTVNKFAGDNIMAVWNAPSSQLNHAFLAVKTAIESQEAIRELNQKLSDLPPVEFGIGINTGEAVAGSVGSKGRAEYTVIGDTVNMASRICGAAPGGRVWIGQQTFEKVKEKVTVSELEPQYFKGKEEAFTIYEVKSLV
jgi:class 3 adenylate cyclase/CHASE2 domain-containing sensor protein